MRKTKTALLAILIFGVLLQTGKLWFEQASGHNFFNNLLNKRVITQESYKIEPENAMVNLGDMKYIKFDASARDGLSLIVDGHIAALVKSGKFVEARPLDLSALLDQKSVIFEYPVSVTAVAFARSFGESSDIFTGKVPVFDTIIILPARTSSENIRYYILDNVSKMSYMFEGTRGVSEALSKEIDRLREISQQSDTVINYISSVQNSLDFFTKNVFLPEWQASVLLYSKVYVTNPVEGAQNLEKCAQLFFDNPVGILSAVDPAGIPFVSDKDTVVKYYEEQELLEYTSYKPKKEVRTTLDAAYALARNFMNRDVTLENDVYMTDATFENGEWELFFDYSWNGMRVFGEFEHAVEITVSGDSVTKYRRIVKRLEASELLGQLEEGFITVLDRILLEEDTEKMDDMELGYDISVGEFSQLVWYVKSDGVWSKAL